MASISHFSELEEVEQKAEELEELLTSKVRELSRAIYEDLQDTFYADSSDEAVKEAIDANDYEFLENGRIA